ncbi:MAG TPA: beta-galactosidase [Marmoricola sp.]|nr:beta-galactosidase [Marmoricola sp.]
MSRRHEFGSSYYPAHHDRGDWARDLDRMRAAGQTVVRTAELLASWDRLEVAKHSYDWSWLDEFFDLVEERGMRILLGTGSQNPPIWMLDEHDDLQIVTADGATYPTAAMWSWACKEHPAYRAEVERHVRTLAQRYGGRAGLYGWQVDNEPGYPFIPWRDRQVELYDYNPHTEAAFVRWLQDRYGTLDALSDAWRWDPTHHRYSSWTQVRAPRAMPMAWAVHTAWLDWQEFTAQRLAEFVGWQASMLRSLTPGLPVSSNMNVWGREDPFHVLMGQDAWQIARHVDAIGFDLYPGIGKRHLREPGFEAMHLSYARSVARAAGVELWYPEIESGPLNGWVMGPDHSTTPDDITRLCTAVVGAGSRLTLFQGWREWACIPIHWGALVDLEGEPTPRRDAAAAVADALSESSVAAVLAEAEPAEPSVALYVDRTNAVSLQGFGNGADLYDAMLGAFRGLHGFEVGFVDPSTVASTSARLLVLPLALLLPSSVGAALTTYVQGGGHLLVQAKAGTVDGRGWSHSRRPGAGLDALLGVVEEDVDTTDEPVTVNLSDGRVLVGAHHVQKLRVVADDAEVVGRFADGSPALVRRGVGDGVAWVCGTHLDLGLLRHGAVENRVFLDSLARDAGAHRMWDVEPGEDGLHRVWAQARHADGRRVVALTSTDTSPRWVTVHLAGATSAVDVLTGERHPLSTVPVPPMGAVLLLTD